MRLRDSIATAGAKIDSMGCVLARPALRMPPDVGAMPLFAWAAEGEGPSDRTGEPPSLSDVCVACLGVFAAFR